MEVMKKQLKENKIGKLYLFTGPEQYLIRYYVKELTNKVLDFNTKILNYTYFEGKVSMEALNDAVSVLPAFSDRRIIVVKESTLLKGGSKEYSWKAFFESLPEYICLIFIQKEIDKRTSFAKTIKKQGHVVECKRQDETALAKWAIKVFASYHKQIDGPTAAFFVSLPEPDMTFLLLEIEKIARYMGEETRVRQEHILNVVTKSVKSRIFDLTDAISQKQTQIAIQIIDELIQLKEPVPFIMAMVSRQLGILLKAKRLEGQNLSSSEMTKLLGVPPFILRKVRKQASYFTLESIKKSIRKCMESDLAVKTGRMDGRMALELLIVEMEVGL